MKVLVIGDSCEDIFMYGKIERVSPEAPVPVIEPIDKTTNIGMAGNVANNLSSLGVDCDLATNTSKITKTRFIDSKSNQMLLRLDENDNLPIDDNYDRFQHLDISEYDAVVVSDYDKGFLNTSQISEIFTKSKIAFLQTSKPLEEWCLGADFIKVNHFEYLKSENFIASQEDQLSKFIVTLGSKGFQYEEKTYPVNNQVDVRDLSGAGDTFLASFVSEYLKDENILESLMFAQNMASAVVEKSGVNVAGDKIPNIKVLSYEENN